MKLTKEKRDRFILTILLMVGLVYGVWYLGIKKQAEKEGRDIRERDRLAQEIKDTETKIKRENNNRENAKAFQNYIAATEEKMPKGNVETWIVKELSDLAAKHNLVLQNTVLQPVKDLSEYKMKNQPYQLEGYHLDFKGEFNQIGTFIQDIENEMPMVEVNDISVTAGSDTAPYIHTVSMSVCVVKKT